MDQSKPVAGAIRSRRLPRLPACAPPHHAILTFAPPPPLSPGSWLLQLINGTQVYSADLVNGTEVTTLLGQDLVSKAGRNAWMGIHPARQLYRMHMRKRAACMGSTVLCKPATAAGLARPRSRPGPRRSTPSPAPRPKAYRPVGTCQAPHACLCRSSNASSPPLLPTLPATPTADRVPGGRLRLLHRRQRRPRHGTHPRREGRRQR